MSTTELSATAALARLTAAQTPIEAAQQEPLAAAYRRILAADLIAPSDLPAFDNAAMDGYALRAADLDGDRYTLHCVGNALAGRAFSGSLQAGQCVRIMTGAMLPVAADTVVMLEDVTVEADRIGLTRRIAVGSNVRRRAEHIAAGSVVLHAGRELGAHALGLAASIGAATLPLRRRLRVGCLSTGDELADAPQPLPPDGCYDGNRPLMLASCSAQGFEAIDLGICPDRADHLQQILAAACQRQLDAVLVSGGAAQGDADIVRQAGGIHFLNVNFRPGRGIATARLQGPARTLLLGLPGNSVACAVMLHLLAMPLLKHCAGGPASLPAHLPLALGAAAHVRGGRIDYRRGRYCTLADGSAGVLLLPEQGSAMLRTLVEADALVALGPQTDYQAGDRVPVLPLATLP